MGGSLASVFAGLIMEVLDVEEQKLINLVTYGAPRPGNADFANYIDEKIKKNGNDC